MHCIYIYIYTMHIALSLSRSLSLHIYIYICMRGKSGTKLTDKNLRESEKLSTAREMENANFEKLCVLVWLK